MSAALIYVGAAILCVPAWFIGNRLGQWCYRVTHTAVSKGRKS